MCFLSFAFNCTFIELSLVVSISIHHIKYLKHKVFKISLYLSCYSKDRLIYIILYILERERLIYIYIMKQKECTLCQALRKIKMLGLQICKCRHGARLVSQRVKRDRGKMER